ncbi:MAG: putative DNA binding domain-containing protein, partial [Bacilli bacterium]|nr:putative DNA binding domain-containing protein [Bacilli bacterium]
MVENEALEFKKTTSEIKEGIISIVSILNKHKKGTLYFGRKNDGSPVEFQINEETLRSVSRKIYEAIKPQIFPIVDTENIDGIDTIRVDFSGDDIPYSAFGKYYIRVADEDRELTPSELRKMMISREYEEHWENKTSKETIDDVDEIILNKFYRDAVKSGRINDIGREKKDLLEILNVLNGNKLTNAGMVLFSKNKPLSMNLVVFATKERITILDSVKVRGNIFELIDAAMDFVVKNIRWRIEIKEGSLQRYEIPEIPLVALREAIINSFAHARYDGNVKHEIDIYSNRISIINPGCFANEFKPEDFYNRQLKSYLRNNVIADVLYLCKDVETCGHGLKKIYTLCKESNISINFFR